MNDPCRKELEGEFGERFRSSVEQVERYLSRAEAQENDASESCDRAESVREELRQVDLSFDFDVRDLYNRTLAAQRAEHDLLEQNILNPMSRAVHELIGRTSIDLEAVIEQARALGGSVEVATQLTQDGDLVIQGRKDLSEQAKSLTKDRDDWMRRVQTVLDECDLK